MSDFICGCGIPFDEEGYCPACDMPTEDDATETEDEPSAGPSAIRGDSPSYRESMCDAGREHLL